MPMFGLRWPDGPYPIGTLKRRFNQITTRSARSVMVQLWYPAKTTSVRRGILGDWSGRIAAAGAEVADGAYPFLLAFSGWGGSLDNNVALSLALASHGFVVAAVGYPTGRDVPSRTIPMDFSSASAFAATIELADRRARLQADMASFVLDMFARLGETDPIRPVADRLSDACVGVFGFSFGGAVAAQVAWQDQRVRAVMNLDGWLFADAALHHFAQPFLLVSDDTPLPDAAELSATDAVRRNRAQLTDRDARWQDAQLAHGGGYKLTVQGSRHDDFCDRPLLNPLRGIASQRAAHARRAMTIVQAYSLSFFGKFLDGRPAALLDAPECAAPYPEARFEVFNCPAWPIDGLPRAASAAAAAPDDVAHGRRGGQPMPRGTAKP